MTKILRAMRDNGSPPPEFAFDADHSYLLVRLPVHPDVARASTDQVTGQVTGQVIGQVAKEVERLLRVLDGEMSRKEIQAAYGLRHRDNLRDAYLARALAGGLVG